MSIKSRGTAFEYRVRRALQAHFWMTFRSAGSHTCADLIAIKPGMVLLVQCKARSYPTLSADEKIQLLMAKTNYGVKVLVICRANMNYDLLFFEFDQHNKLTQIDAPEWL